MHTYTVAVAFSTLGLGEFILLVHIGPLCVVFFWELVSRYFVVAPNAIIIKQLWLLSFSLCQFLRFIWLICLGVIKNENTLARIYNAIRRILWGQRGNVCAIRGAISTSHTSQGERMYVKGRLFMREELWGMFTIW